MHELSLLDEMLRLVLDEAARQRARSVEAIRLEVGALSGVEPEALRFGFDAVVAGTIAAAARLEIEPTEGVAFCPQCQEEFATADIICLCPQCGRPSGEIRHGQDLTLVSVEFATDD